MHDGRRPLRLLAYASCVAATAVVIAIWSATPTGIDVYEALRLLAVAFGLWLAAANLIAIVTGDAVDRSRAMLLTFGIVIAVSSALAPRLLPTAVFGEWKIPLATIRKPQPRPAAILAINDVYRIEGLAAEGKGGLARLRTLRRHLEESHDVLMLHAGDLLFPSYSSNFFQGRQMIDTMNLLDGRDATGTIDPRLYVAFGNHEFDAADCDRPVILRERVAESDFRWLASNIHFDGCAQGGMNLTSANVVDASIVTVGGVKIGLFSLLLDLGSARPYPPIDGRSERSRIAARLAKSLREKGAEIVVAVTHLPYQEDQDLLAWRAPAGQTGDVPTDGPDLIVGGHDHERMAYTADGRWLFKADSDAATATFVTLERDDTGKVQVSQRFLHVDDRIEEDPVVKRRVDYWMRKQDTVACAAKSLPAGCLDQVVNVAGEPLEGEENKIRNRQTSLGTWVTNFMLAAYGPSVPVDGSGGRCTMSPRIAFINAGSLRLNTDIPRGGKITLRSIEELLPFSTELRLVSVSANTLLQLMGNSAKQRGAGGWLQASGIRLEAGAAETRVFVRSVESSWVDLATVSDRDAKIFPVVTTAWLLHRGGDHDGYDIDASPPLCPALDLKALLVGDHLQSGKAGSQY
jgi:5'-nucleotidase